MKKLTLTTLLCFVAAMISAPQASATRITLTPEKLEEVYEDLKKAKPAKKDKLAKAVSLKPVKALKKPAKIKLAKAVKKKAAKLIALKPIVAIKKKAAKPVAIEPAKALARKSTVQRSAVALTTQVRTPVPDSGTSLVLLGMGLGALGFFARKRRFLNK